MNAHHTQYNILAVVASASWRPMVGGVEAHERGILIVTPPSLSYAGEKCEHNMHSSLIHAFASAHLAPVGGYHADVVH
jgi:hypothetical protein